VVSGLQAIACSPDTTSDCIILNSWCKNKISRKTSIVLDLFGYFPSTSSAETLVKDTSEIYYIAHYNPVHTIRIRRAACVLCVNHGL